jgi:hypothetical protein
MRVHTETMKLIFSVMARDMAAFGTANVRAVKTHKRPLHRIPAIMAGLPHQHQEDCGSGLGGGLL